MSQNIYILIILLILCTSCKGQKEQERPKAAINKEVGQEIKVDTSYKGPNTITLNIIQDEDGNIWLAAFDGVFRYDGAPFLM